MLVSIIRVHWTWLEFDWRRCTSMMYLIFQSCLSWPMMSLRIYIHGASCLPLVAQTSKIVPYVESLSPQLVNVSALGNRVDACVPPRLLVVLLFAWHGVMFSELNQNTTASPKQFNSMTAHHEFHGATSYVSHGLCSCCSVERFEDLSYRART